MFEHEHPDGCDVALLFIPDDEGIRRNHGRPGAAEGPAGVCEALMRYGVREPGGITWPRVFDAGQIMPAGEDLEETHRRVTEATGALVDAGMLPIAIGGGHDLTFPFVRALCDRGLVDAGVYLDAHLDVRAEVGSGMPFRRLVEDCGVRELHALGIDRFAAAAEHVAWFAENGGRIDDLEPGDPMPGTGSFLSLDLDVLDQAFAPGVSATNPAGWSPIAVERWVAAAGRDPKVRCFDIMELSPPHDPEQHTARLAARMLMVFLEAFASRPTG